MSNLQSTGHGQDLPRTALLQRFQEHARHTGFCGEGGHVHASRRRQLGTIIQCPQRIQCFQPVRQGIDARNVHQMKCQHVVYTQRHEGEQEGAEVGA